MRGVVGSTHLGEEVSGGPCDGRWEEEVVVQDAFVHHVHIAVVERELRIAHPTPPHPTPMESLTLGRERERGFGRGLGFRGLGVYQPRQHFVE